MAIFQTTSLQGGASRGVELGLGLLGSLLTVLGKQDGLAGRVIGGEKAEEVLASDLSEVAFAGEVGSSRS